MKFVIDPLKAEMDRRIAEINACITTNPQEAIALLERMEQYMKGYMQGFRNQVISNATSVQTYLNSLS